MVNSKPVHIYHHKRKPRRHKHKHKHHKRRDEPMKKQLSAIFEETDAAEQVGPYIISSRSQKYRTLHSFLVGKYTWTSIEWPPSGYRQVAAQLEDRHKSG